MPTKWEIAGLLCVLALLSALIFRPGQPSAEGLHAQISVNGEIVARLSLQTGGQCALADNTVVAEDGFVWMESAGCADHSCRRQGRISRAGQSICCLPNRVFVQIVSDKSGALDAVTY